MTLCKQLVNVYDQITSAGYLKICLFISDHGTWGSIVVKELHHYSVSGSIPSGVSHWGFFP